MAALTDIAGTGKITADRMGEIGLAATAMSRVTGRSVKEIVGEFVQRAEEPAKASAKLSEQYHSLTASVYEQIKALEEQGQKEQAAALAQDALAKASITRAKQVQENLGYLATAWNGVGKAAKWAW